MDDYIYTFLGDAQCVLRMTSSCKGTGSSASSSVYQFTMTSMLVFLIVYGILVCMASAFLHSPTKISTQRRYNKDAVVPNSNHVLSDVPLELTGQLDPSKKWDVKFIFKGVEKIVSIAEDCSVLEMGEKIFDDVDSSCRTGICTTCAGQCTIGRENIRQAVHGLGKEQIDNGFVCACQTYVVGPGVVVNLGMYDQCYESQYGQYEKSYEMKFGAKKEEPDKKKNLFGF